MNDKADYERGYNDAVEECAKIAERFTLDFVVDDHGANIADEIRRLNKS